MHRRRVITSNSCSFDTTTVLACGVALSLINSILTQSSVLGGSVGCIVIIVAVKACLPTKNNNFAADTSLLKLHQHPLAPSFNSYHGTIVLAIGVAFSLINLILTVYLIETAALKTYHEHRPNPNDHVMHDAPSSLAAQRRAGVPAAAINANKGEEEDGISACLLVNDENPRLPEWLAYHYTTLPLRHLIIAVDPASRSNPHSILDKWYNETGLQSQIWSDEQYLPSPKMRGPCPYLKQEEGKKKKKDAAKACLEHHRNRQQHFVIKCMSEFKRINNSWVLLMDVDEYVVFNQIRKDDPASPIDYETISEKEGGKNIPIMSDWRYHNADSKSSHNNERGNDDNDAKIGIIDGFIEGKYTKTGLIFTKQHESICYGRVVSDINRNKYFLRDDIAYYESTSLPNAPPGIPTLKGTRFAGTSLYANIYNDTYKTNYNDGQFVPIPMDWKSGDIQMRTFYGGHISTDVNGHKYYIENEHAFWPPHYRAKDSMAARAKLPSIGEGGTTILDVLKSQAKEEYTGGALGPCITMPRVLYGSRDVDGNDNTTHHHGFNENKFVTLRYRWHASKGQFDESKYGKTIIDVSRIPQESLYGEAYNIHRPLIYYCRKDPQPYSVSLFRVNHYLDSFEAYSYRNDVRSKQRQCKECYEKKGKGAAVAADDDIEPWLQRFVNEVGYEKAQRLLSNAGDFVKLQRPATEIEHGY